MCAAHDGDVAERRIRGRLGRELVVHVERVLIALGVVVRLGETLAQGEAGLRGAVA